MSLSNIAHWYSNSQCRKPLSRKSSNRCYYEIVLNWISQIRECPLIWVYWTNPQPRARTFTQHSNTSGIRKGAAKFSVKITTWILPHSMVTRVTFIEFTPAQRAVTLDQSRRVQLRTFDAPVPRLPRATPNPVSLSSYRWASVALFAYYWRAACRQQAIEIPSLSIRTTLLFLSLCHSVSLAKREKHVPGVLSDKNFNMALHEPYHAVSTYVIFEFYRMKSRNCAATKYTWLRNITRESNAATAGDCNGGEKSVMAVTPM